MKKFIAPMLIGATLATAAIAADDSLRAEIAALKVQMAELKEAQSKVNYDALKKQLSEVKAHSAGDNIKFSVDFRTAYDYIDYKTSGGDPMVGSNMDFSGGMPPVVTPISATGAGYPAVKSGKGHNNIWTNKLILNMAAQPVDNLVFKGAIGAYSTFGQSSMNSQNAMFQSFDWYGTQKPTDSTIKLREAYFLYFGEMGDVNYSASFGRRPSTDGFMTNLREDNDHPASPVGHNINMEFDGASFKFDFDKITGVSGLYFKLCIGRGFSDTTGAYSMNMSTNQFNPAYMKASNNPNMDLIGLLAQLYDDGQYKVLANYFHGSNMMGAGMDMTITAMDSPAGANQYMIFPGFTDANNPMNGFHDVGDMDGYSLSIRVNGIGDEINDFLDDTVFFASFAGMKTKPNNNGVNDVVVNDTTAGGLPAGLDTMLIEQMNGAGMLGSTDSETGYSYYVGLNIPGFMEADRIGLEYNHGSKYWRSFTYGEDTLAGSKLATRGDAYELYYNLPLVSKNLTAQFRYTYMDYDYTGSDTFFGQTGTPTDVDSTPGAVKSASNIRLSMRYRY